MKKLLCTTAALAALTLSMPAQAGSFNGPYLGLQLGHNNTKIDSRWNDVFGGGENFGIDSGGSGLEFGAVAGYRVKQDRFVLGVEVDGMLSNAKATLLSYDDGVDALSLEVEKRYSYAIGPRVGYLVTDSSLAFVGVDWTRGSFKATSTVNGVTETDSDDDNGFRFGGGIEIAATKEVSLRLDYQHTIWEDSSDADFSIEAIEDTARIGAIYSF